MDKIHILKRKKIRSNSENKHNLKKEKSSGQRSEFLRFTGNLLKGKSQTK